MYTLQGQEAIAVLHGNLLSTTFQPVRVRLFFFFATGCIGTPYWTVNTRGSIMWAQCTGARHQFLALALTTCLNTSRDLWRALLLYAYIQTPRTHSIILMAKNTINPTQNANPVQQCFLHTSMNSSYNGTLLKTSPLTMWWRRGFFSKILHYPGIHNPHSIYYLKLPYNQDIKLLKWKSNIE